MAPNSSEPRDGTPPPYTKYRAGRNPFRREPVEAGPRRPAGAGGSAPPPAGDRPYTLHRAGGGQGEGTRRLPRFPLPRRRGGPIRKGRIALRVLLGLVGWVLLSGVVFLVSAFVHRDDVGGGLSSRGFPPLSATTVMVLGSDQRPKSSKEPGARSDGAPRADSILLMRIGGGHNARLSIPRDTVVDIPGRGPNKINAAFAFGGASLMARTIEQSIGIKVDHVVEVSFSNFPDLIDAMGGIDYEGSCVVSKINGGFKNGGYTLRLKSGKTRIDGKQALALARTRKNECAPKESDLTRARRQQKLFSSMKKRLISPGAFVRLPFISWAVPKSIRSDMGGPTLMGLFAGLATASTPKTRILKPTGVVSSPAFGDGLEVNDEARQRAARRFNRE